MKGLLGLKDLKSRTIKCYGIKEAVNYIKDKEPKLNYEPLLAVHFCNLIHFVGTIQFA